jgi:hypothetical protein
MTSRSSASLRYIMLHSATVKRPRGVKKRCRLSWLTNSALVYESKGGGGCRLPANEYSTAERTQEPKKTFGDQNPYLTFERIHLNKETLDGNFQCLEKF